MPSDYEYVSEYWKIFLDIKRNLETYSNFEEQCAAWCELFSDWASVHRSLTGVELALSNIKGLVLCHPAFSVDKSGDNFRHILDSQRIMHVYDNERRGRCQLRRLNGSECIFNSYDEFKGQLVGDHEWPYSLGGPSNDRNDIHRNRLLLCEYCNSTKSSSILLFDFSNDIEWLEHRLHQIFVRKH